MFFLKILLENHDSTPILEVPKKFNQALLQLQQECIYTLAQFLSIAKIAIAISNRINI